MITIEDEQTVKYVEMLSTMTDMAHETGVLTEEDYEICGLHEGDPGDPEVDRRRLIALLDRTCHKTKVWLQQQELQETPQWPEPD